MKVFFNDRKNRQEAQINHESHDFSKKEVDKDRGQKGKWYQPF